MIVGGGQAGLAVGYHLKKRGRPFLILDAQRAHRRLLAHALGLAAPVHAGEVRRPARHALSGAAAGRSRRRTRWATTSRRTRSGSGCPSRTGVTRRAASHAGRRALRRRGRRAAVRGRPRDRRVRRAPRPQDPGVRAASSTRASSQLHSSEYRNPAQLRDGQRAGRRRRQLGRRDRLRARADTRDAALGQAESGEIPVRHGSFAGAARPAGHPVRRPPRPDAEERRSAARSGRRSPRTATPLIRVKSKDLDGGRRRARAAGRRRARRPARCSTTAGSSTSRTSIWCTGFRHDFSVDRPPRVRARTASPMHDRGVVRAAPGSLLRRAALPVRRDLRRAPRRRPRREVRREAHRARSRRKWEDARPMAYVYDFDDASGGGRELLGGKGAGLAEMTQIGVPVPAGLHDHDRRVPRLHARGQATAGRARGGDRRARRAASRSAPASASAMPRIRCSSPCARARRSRCRG